MSNAVGPAVTGCSVAAAALQGWQAAALEGANTSASGGSDMDIEEREEHSSLRPPGIDAQDWAPEAADGMQPDLTRSSEEMLSTELMRGQHELRHTGPAPDEVQGSGWGRTWDW